MNKIVKQIDAYMICMLLEIFIIVTFFIINQDTSKSLLDFIMFCTIFLTTIITYITNIIIGLIISSIIVFVYASYIFYTNFFQGNDIQYISYFWIACIPIVSLTMGKLSTYINAMQETNVTLMKNNKELITIDKNTGLGNIKLFYMTLEKEMSAAKRHKTPCTLMLIKLPYYKDIRNIIGEEKTSKLLKEITDIITFSTRNEDNQYTLENDTLAIIMPLTDIDGANIVKNRIKDNINELNLKLKEEKDFVTIDIKISVLEYNKNIKTPMEFKMLTQEELQYDV